MKRLFLVAAVAMLGMTACQKSESFDAVSGDVDITVSTSLPAQMAETRAAGDGTTVDRCIMQIYLDGELYGERQVAAVENLSATFSARLIAGKTFDLVFWADKSGADINSDLHYNTADLANVAFTGDYIGNDDARDAFFGTAQVISDKSQAVNVELKRPFGQLNVKTLDLAEVKAASPALEPKKVKIEFKSVPTGINLLTGELTDAKSAVAYADAAAVVDAEGHLSFDYVLAPAGTEQFLADFTMSFLDENGAEVAGAYDFSSIPVQRNYRTNVSGNLLTKKADINVEVKPGFDGDITSNDDEVSGANLQTKLDGLATDGIFDYNITVTDNLPAGEYTIPALNANSSLSINLVGADGEVTFKGESFAGLLELGSTAETAITVNIDVPNGDAALNSGRWSVASVTTKPTTFTINGGAEVDVINVAGGNVVINEGADVDTVNRTEDNQDETTTVTVFDGAEQPATNDDKINIQTGVSGQIVIGNKSFATIRDAVIAAKAGDVIVLAAGNYDLGEPAQKDAAGPYGYYLKIDTPVTIKAKGDGEVIVTTSHEAPQNIGGVGSLQNLVTVNAANVTIEGITFVANYNLAYEGPNKVVLAQGENFTAKDCRFLTNDKAPQNGGSAIYFALNGVNGLVENCEINNATVSFDGFQSGNFTIKNNTFNGGTSNLVLTTPNWTSNKMATSTMNVTVEGNTFTNLEEYNGENYPSIRVSHGIVNLKNNKFPTDGIYWAAAAWDSNNTYGAYCNFGAVYVDYNSPVSQTWTKDRTEPKSFAISNDKVELETMEAPANTWYAWHGRKAAVNMAAKNTWEVSSTLTLTGENRAVNKSIWLNIGIDWPIILFKQDENGNRTWRYWDSTGSGAWLDVPAEKNIPTTAGEYNIKIAFNNGTITHTINGVEVASYKLDETKTAVKEIIFNSYSIGESYKTTWSYPVVK